MTTPIFNMHDIVLILTIVASFALALFQPILPLKNRITKVLLAVFFISLSISNVGTMLIWNLYIDSTAVVLMLVPYFYAGSLLVKGPVLNFYVRGITEDGFRLKISHCIHLAPILIVFAVITVFGIDANDLRLTNFGTNYAKENAVKFVWYAIKAVPLAYFIAAMVRSFVYHKRLKEQYSNLNEPALTWLYCLTLGFVLTGIWTFLVTLLGYLYSLPIGITDNYFSFLLLIALFYYSVSHAQNLTPTKRESGIKAAETKPLDTIIRKITDGVEKDKLHLNQTVNIEQFSKQIELSPRDVSYAINKVFGTNFFEFINSYRVEEAKRLLSSKDFENLTVLEILLEAGFNSKSSFQRFFKRLTGMSPTEYRKQSTDEKA